MAGANAAARVAAARTFLDDVGKPPSPTVPVQPGLVVAIQPHPEALPTAASLIEMVGGER